MTQSATESRLYADIDRGALGIDVPIDDLREITFVDELVNDVVTEAKTATTRYGAYKTLHVGDTVIAKTTDGDALGLLRITHTASIPAGNIHDFVTMVDAKYSSTSPEDAVTTINTHYTDTITADTTVNVLVFELIHTPFSPS
jgi:hypothetical protein